MFKSFLISAFFVFSINGLAKDMSREEDYKIAYKDNSDGSVTYVGACSLHQDYEDKKFIVTKTLVKYFEPSSLNKMQVMNKFRSIEKQLIDAVGGLPFILDTDDITLEKIEHKKLKNFDLYRFNIGVGGGNGYYEVYQRVLINNQVSFKKLANIFDGDVEFCDSSVWKK
jgi:hypothetical protein